MRPRRGSRPAPGGLLLATAAGTDFWQGTHYGFRVDNGHALLAEAAGDFVLSTRVRDPARHQYDQAGLMVRLSPSCWLKTSVEFEPGEPSRLGAVVTNHGWSDWSTQDLDPDLGRDLAFRITRTGPTTWSRLPWPAAAGASCASRACTTMGGPVRAGLYACSPKDAGFEATFARLTITDRPA